MGMEADYNWDQRNNMKCEQCGKESQERICDDCYPNMKWICSICGKDVGDEDNIIYCDCGNEVCDDCWIDEETRSGWNESHCKNCHKFDY